VRVVSYNVRYFSQRTRGLYPTRAGLDAIAAALLALRPRIICLQELRAEWQFDALLRAMPGYHGRYFPVHQWGRIYGTALAILVDGEAILRSELAWLLPGLERRACAHVQLRDVHVFNTHLSLPGFARFGHGNKQLLQADQVRQIVAGHKDPFILCGDFNARPSSPVHRLFSWPSVGTGLDHIFAGNGARLDPSSADGFAGLSDHQPVVATMAL
jgi:endonuclease/exonuclease/phosphatase family metal-dependent hydrolase